MVNKFGTKLFVLMAGVLAVLVGSASAASAAHYHTFTQNSEYFDATDSNGRFAAQANMHSGWVVTMPWSFQISPAVQAIATSPMNCRAGHNQLPYSDTHNNIPVSYHWHSSVPGNKVDNTKYDLWGNCTFRVNAGGRPGSANLNFQFHYSMFCGPCKPKTMANDRSESRLTSQLEIEYDA